MNTTCSICLETCEDKGGFTMITECNHAFHGKCSDEWFKLKGTCPCCRHTLISYNVYEEEPEREIVRAYVVTRDGEEIEVDTRNFSYVGSPVSILDYGYGEEEEVTSRPRRPYVLDYGEI
jgi:hypothetical protein